MTYQGWSNKKTWNIALYINNERDLYQVAKACNSYKEFLSHLVPGAITPDGVLYTDPSLDTQELDEVIQDIVA